MFLARLARNPKISPTSKAICWHDLIRRGKAPSSSKHPPCQVAELGALALHEQADAEDAAGGIDETGRGRQQKQYSEGRLPPGNSRRHRKSANHHHWRCRRKER